MDRKYTKEECLALLVQKQCELGDERFPQRSDFSEAEVVAIKAHLGPWPRALEAAGIKPPREDDRKEKNREKRIRAKRRRTEARRAPTPCAEHEQRILAPRGAVEIKPSKETKS